MFVYCVYCDFSVKEVYTSSHGDAQGDSCVDFFPNNSISRSLCFIPQCVLAAGERDDWNAQTFYFPVPKISLDCLHIVAHILYPSPDRARAEKFTPVVPSTRRQLLSAAVSAPDSLARRSVSLQVIIRTREQRKEERFATSHSTWRGPD